MPTIKKLLFCLCILSSSVAVADEIPLKAFASLPLISNVQLSPDGLSTAYFQNIEGHSYLVTQTAADKPKVILTSDNIKFYFRSFRWVNNDRLLVGVRYPAERYGSQTTETRLIAINRDASNLEGRLLQSELDSFYSHKNIPQLQDNILGNVAGDSHSVLIALDLEHQTLPDVYQLNVDTTRLRKVIPNPGYVHEWMADRQGEVRIGSGWRGKTVKTIVKPPGASSWQPLSSYTIDDLADAKQNKMTPLGFDADPRFLYVTAEYQGHDAVFKLDLGQPGFPRELIHADQKFDVSGLMYAPWLKKVVGLHYNTDYGSRIYWDDSARDLQQQIDKALPNHANNITSSSDDGMRHIISSSSNSAPTRIYALNRKTGSLQLMADTQPELRPEKLTLTRPVTFKSRDNLTLHGYLTLPQKVPLSAPQKKLSLIVFPHGGPVSRDVAGFDEWTQFFANRGWMVLQINFRGSSGYGQDFQAAGFKRWGMEMQDDLTDGVDWLVTLGAADPQKVCVVGASYGGYAAMMGAIKTPDLYRCAVSIAGVADLRDLLAQQQHYIGYEVAVESQIGEWWGDRERLRQTSPTYRAKELRTPLLLIHGKQDRTVEVEQSRDMASALKDAGNKNYHYVELPLGDHSLSREEDRITTFTEMEKFLKKYLD